MSKSFQKSVVDLEIHKKTKMEHIFQNVKQLYIYINILFIILYNMNQVNFITLCLDSSRRFEHGSFGPRLVGAEMIGFRTPKNCKVSMIILEFFIIYRILWVLSVYTQYSCMTLHVSNFGRLGHTLTKVGMDKHLRPRRQCMLVMCQKLETRVATVPTKLG